MKELDRIQKKLMNDHGIAIPVEALVMEHTNSEADQLEALRSEEWSGFLMLVRARYRKELTTPWNQTPANQMRRKVIALFVYKMGYTMPKMEAWVEKYSVAKKKFNKHTYHELVTLVSQAERVYKSYVRSINKQSVN